MMQYLGWLFLGIVTGALSVFFARRKNAWQEVSNASTIASLLRNHFAPSDINQLSISKRQFPYRVRADLQKTVDSILATELKVHHFSGVRTEYSHSSATMSDCILDNTHNPAYAIPPEYEELEVGDEIPIRVLKSAIWLLEIDEGQIALMLSPCGTYGDITGVQIEIATINDAVGARITQKLFAQLEEAVASGKTYRGKILSLQRAEHSYSGKSSGITVHKLRKVQRDEVILPASTLDLLERNVIDFARNRSRLAEVGLSKKKGLLFYGPPGTGKTHTLHHLANSLAGHTTLIIAAEQVGLLGEYMTLARLLQPSIVLIEDVDLIARDRSTMGSPCEEVLLNKLLNEMDGLTEDAEIFFILTTNRPEALEEALASRPGRIDQAIEFPLPDEIGRRKLIKLYAPSIDISDELVESTVNRTKGVSAAFLKELMRRSTQYAMQRNDAQNLIEADLDSALNEMLHSGGVLNRRILGAQEQ